MSLYNQLFGVNKFGAIILHLLDLKVEDVPRIRDAYVTDASELAVFARIGGNNRPHHEEGIAMLRAVPGYLRDADDSFDSTYATFFYAAPEAFSDLIPELLAAQGHYDPMERFKQLLDDMKHDRDTPLARRGIEVGKPIVESIAKAISEQARLAQSTEDTS